MAVLDTGNTTPNGINTRQRLWLEAGVLASSQAALQAVNSGVTLAATGNTIRGKPPGRLRKTTLAEVSITFQDVPNNESFTGCNAVAANVMGSLRAPHLGNQQATHGKFGKAVNGSKQVPTGATIWSSLTAYQKHVTGEADPDDAKAEWGQRSYARRVSAAKKYKTDRYAKPKAAEAIGVQHGTGNSGGHFAGVLARSGNDYVTVENFAGNAGAHAQQGLGSINPNWFVRMFGARKNESFWDFHRLHETEEYGDRPIVARVKRT